jgi:hypothetical protein
LAAHTNLNAQMTDMAEKQNRLRLKAADEEDLCIISAMVQDAIVPVRDIGYVDGDLRFAMVINRFMWERCNPEVFAADMAAELAGQEAPETDGEEAKASYFRTLSAVRFEQVTRVEQRGLDPNRGWDMLDLLAIEYQDQNTVVIHFAGEASLRLTVVRLDCHFEDLGEAWPSTCRPVHTLEGERTVECEQEAGDVSRFGEPQAEADATETEASDKASV